MQLLSHNRQRSSHTVGGNQCNHYAWIVKKCEIVNRSIILFSCVLLRVKGRSLGDVTKNTVPYRLRHKTVTMINQSQYL